MKSIIFIAFLVIAAVGCDTPESTTGTEASPSMNSDSMTSMPSTADTVATMPVDTTATMPVDTTQAK